MRCLTLARELSRRGELCRFVCREHPGHLFDLIGTEFPLHALPAPPSNKKSVSTEGSYSDWLGCSQDQDAVETLQSLGSTIPAGITWVVVDHYSLDAHWHDQIRQGLNSSGGNLRLLVIDDLANRPLHADLLLDQNRLDNSGSMIYQSIIPTECRCLVGPHYALLGDAFRMLRPLLDQRRGPLQRLLIFFGGTDLPNLTECCLRGLLEPSPLPIKLDVVLGQANPHKERIKEFLADQPLARLHNPLPSLAGIMAQADIAIGAGGVTSWERACLALPSLLACIAANQRIVIDELVEAGAALKLGSADDLTPTRVREEVANLIKHPDLLHELSYRASTICDGWGSRRVTAAMIGLQNISVKIRAARLADEALWLRWANDPGTREASFSPNLIDSKDHHTWFVGRIADPNSLLLLAEACDGLPLGYIRFERNQPSLDDHEVLISIAVEPAVRGQGFALPLLKAAIQELQFMWKLPLLLLAEVKEGNTASKRLFMSAGFEASRSRRSSSLCFQRQLSL